MVEPGSPDTKEINPSSSREGGIRALARRVISLGRRQDTTPHIVVPEASAQPQQGGLFSYEQYVRVPRPENTAATRDALMKKGYTFDATLDIPQAITADSGWHVNNRYQKGPDGQWYTLQGPSRQPGQPVEIGEEEGQMLIRSLNDALRSQNFQPGDRANELRDNVFARYLGLRYATRSHSGVDMVGHANGAQHADTIFARENPLVARNMAQAVVARETQGGALVHYGAPQGQYNYEASQAGVVQGLAVARGFAESLPDKSLLK
jgi:hypothetical protein